MLPRVAGLPAHLVLLGACLLLAGCPGDATPPAAPDGGDSGIPPEMLDPALDQDVDGLCNGTELARGTDPFAGDTDADGYSDWMEISFGFNPLLPASPDRSIVFALSESTEASIQVPIPVRVRGGGEDYAGGFEADPARDPLGLTAEAFFTSAVALHADPPENAAAVDVEEQVFRVVVGDTVLAYEARFAFAENLERRCVRAYPFRYTVKRSDGRFVANERLILLVLPQGETLRTAEWCAPSGCI